MWCFMLLHVLQISFYPNESLKVVHQFFIQLAGSGYYASVISVIIVEQIKMSDKVVSAPE